MILEYWEIWSKEGLLKWDLYYQIMKREHLPSTALESGGRLSSGSIRRYLDIQNRKERIGGSIKARGLVSPLPSGLDSRSCHIPLTMTKCGDCYLCHPHRVITVSVLPLLID